MTTISLKRIRRRQSNGRTKFVWMLRWFDDKGQHCGKTIGECSQISKRDAEAIRREQQSKIDCGLIKADRPIRLTLSEYAGHDREAIVDRAYATRLEHDYAVAHAKGALGGGTRLESIGRRHVAKLKRYLLDKGLRPATVDKTLRTLRAMFGRAVREGALHENPFAGERVRWDPRDSRIFEPHELAAMLRVSPDDWWTTFLRLLSTTGLRLNEALHLHWEHIDLRVGRVRVRRQDAGTFEVEGRSYPLLPWSAKAKSSYREIPLPAETIDQLRRWKLKAGKSAYVFVDLKRLAILDARIQAGTFRPSSEIVPKVLAHFKRLQEAARKDIAKRRGIEVEDVPWRVGCLHDLRDTYLTSIKGVPIDVLKRIAGHSTLATTLKYYTSPTARDADAVLDALASSGFAETARRF